MRLMINLKSHRLKKKIIIKELEIKLKNNLLEIKLKKKKV